MRSLFCALALTAAVAAQPPKSILGTVTEFRMASLEIGLQPDEGSATFFKVSPQTDVVQVEPGERDLSKAKKVRVTDLSLTDRVLVSFVPGMKEARRIILISANDLAKRNEDERIDWKKRGVSGTVIAIDGDRITLNTRAIQGPPSITVVVTPKTMIRRYAPDSVKFADAQWSKAAEIAVGDQVRTRGEKGADGAILTAQDVVFGTFRSAIGSITAIDTEGRRVTIDDLVTKKPLTIHVSADTQLKSMPDFRWMYQKGGGGHDAPPPESAPIAKAVSDPQKLDVAKLLDKLPLAKFDALKVGGAVMVTCMGGLNTDDVTATRIVTNADFLIETAKAAAAQHPGMSSVDVISGMHGGALGGSGGLSLPAIVP